MNRIVITAAALAAFASPALAKKEKVVFVESAAVKDKPVVSLDPAKGYLLVRSDAWQSDAYAEVHLMRVPDAEDQAKYDALKAEALAEAREEFAKKKALYDKEKASYDKAGPGAPRQRMPEMPIEPTEQNFEFTPFGLMASTMVGPLYRFSKGKGTSTYLHEITPGTYRIYRTSTLSCYCLGSVKFDVKAGEITDLGHFDQPEKEQIKRDMKLEKSDSSRPRSFAPVYRVAQAGAPLDPRLSGIKLVPAVLKPVGKLPNYFGTRIDRFPAIEGVMRYDRDRIVDLTTGN